MKSLLLLALTACMSTRMVADATDPRLRVPDHHEGFIVHTTERWKERIDPATGIQFGDAHGRWSQSLGAGDLKVDATGAWLDKFAQPWDAADAVRIEGMSEKASALIEKTRPIGGLLERDGDAWVLSGGRTVLERWLQEIEINVARLEPLEFVKVPDPQMPGEERTLADDDAKLYQLRTMDMGTPLGTWSFSTRGGAWQTPMHGSDLIQFIEGGRHVRVGWKWADIAHVRVTNLSGAKTLGGMVLAVAATAGFFVAAGAAGAIAPAKGSAPATGGGSDGSEIKRNDWPADLAPISSDNARSLFASSAVVRWFIRPMLTFDGTAAYRGDFVSSGLSARLHLFELFEIGGGAREVLTRNAMTTERSTTGNFQLGMHLPFDAAHHYAGVFGLDIGGGGHVDADLRIPWGLRLAQGRWLATIQPATPQFIRVDGNKGRWAATGGVDLGFAF